jgi:hypothetical protein
MSKRAKVAAVLIGGAVLTAYLYSAPPAWAFRLFGTPEGLMWAPVVFAAILVPVHVVLTRKQRANG